jgi:hypothetical protein
MIDGKLLVKTYFFLKVCIYFYNLHSSLRRIRIIKSRKLSWAGHVARIVKDKNAYRILVGKPEGKRQLGRPRRKWENIIKMDLRNMGWGGVDWIDLAQHKEQWRPLVNMVMNIRVPLSVGKLLNRCATGGFSRRVQCPGVS